jgi:hypothetical protein
MLFDHGCDSFTVTFVIMCTGKFLNFGNTIHTVIWFSACISLFHFAILEEYYLGGMVLGICNPITDLSIVVYAVYIYLGISGNSIFHSVLFKEKALWSASPMLTVIDVLYYWCIVVTVLNVIYCIKKIFTNKRYEGKGKEAKWYIVLFHSLTYIVMVLAVTSLAYVGSNPMISQTQDKAHWPAFWVMLL